MLSAHEQSSSNINPDSQPGQKEIYYRLIAIWVLCEAMLGGIIHGLKIPVSGLVVGSCAIICICLIAWYAPARGAILKATIVVAVFKMMLSPQAPPPAYIAVFFQGMLGELLFRKKQFFKISCILLAVLGLLESGFQRILVLTILYGNDFWTVINDFINGLTKQKVATNYSLLIGGGYVLIHLVAGIVVGLWVSGLPGRIILWRHHKQYAINIPHDGTGVLPARSKKIRRLKKGLFLVWILLIALYIQSYFRIGEPLLPAHISMKILLRSVIIVLGWIFIIGPLIKKVLHKWLQKKQSQSTEDIEQVLRLLPEMQQLAAVIWRHIAIYKGWKRILMFCRLLLVNILSPVRSPGIRDESLTICILTAPIRSGKTTSLVKWSENRNDVHGILTPDVDGKRVFMNAATRQLFLMEAKEGDKDVLEIGRFAFSRTNFERAISIVRDGIFRPGWMVIDEIGPMELRGEGFHDVLKEVIAGRKGKLLLVVRDKDGMVEKVKALIGLPGVIIVKNIAELESF